MSTIQTRMRRNVGGFTLVEVLTAISLVGVISAIAATNFNSFLPGYRARGAAMQIAGDMNQARLAAVKEGRRYYYQPIAGTSYEIQRDNGLGGQVVLKTVNIAAEYPQVTFGKTGITVDPYGAAIGPAVPAARITFNSDGTITGAAAVYVEPTVTAAHAQHGVFVTAAGRVRVWHYTGTVWK